MKYVDEFRDGDVAAKLGEKLAKEASRIDKTVTFMEVCGTHTMAIFRHGLRKTFIPKNIRLVSGPGCPVCVTPKTYVDTAIAMAQKEGVVITTFGDMIRVPGSVSSLQMERAKGSDITVVWSPIDAVEIARNAPDKEVIFLGVGFETTAPTVAAAILTAEREEVKNFSVLAAHKVMPEPMDALTEGDLAIDGYICPAHVSAIIGEEGYGALVAKRKIPCVITGFEPLDILQGVTMLASQVADGRAEVENQYKRVVLPTGNKKAQAMLEKVFTKSDAVWRGLGPIQNSGLAIAEKYKTYDAAKKFPVKVPEAKENKACICGEILKGLKEPEECRIFGKGCTPDNPVGACMVSSEGTCAAAYRYGGMGIEHG